MRVGFKVHTTVKILIVVIWVVISRKSRATEQFAMPKIIPTPSSLYHYTYISLLLRIIVVSPLPNFNGHKKKVFLFLYPVCLKEEVRPVE